MQTPASLLQATRPTLTGVVIVWQCLATVCWTMDCSFHQALLIWTCKLLIILRHKLSLEVCQPQSSRRVCTRKHSGNNIPGPFKMQTLHKDTHLWGCCKLHSIFYGKDIEAKAELVYGSLGQACMILQHRCQEALQTARLLTKQACT